MDTSYRIDISVEFKTESGAVIIERDNCKQVLVSINDECVCMTEDEFSEFLGSCRTILETDTNILSWD
jgi:hypothetical protein